jgi:cobalt-zinc-cadmium efflux system membrane fusion protein
MSTFQLAYGKRAPWVALAVVAGLVLIGWLLFRDRIFPRSASNVAAEALTGVPAIPAITQPKESGKVGDLVITQEAIELAEIRIARGTTRLVADKLPVSGAVEPGGDRLVKITPRVGGKVVAVSAVVGDAVRAGQVLGRIESGELAQAQAAYQQAATRVALARNNLRRQRKLAELGAFGQPRVEEARRAEITAQGEVSLAENDVAAATAELAEAKSHLGALQAAVTQAQTQVKVTQSRFQRQGALLKEELTSRQDWEQAQADAERAQADVVAAEANLTQGQAKINTAQARLNAARAKLAEAQKRARIATQTLMREEAVLKGGYATGKEIVEAEAALASAELEQRAAERSVTLLGGRPGGGAVVALTTPITGRVQERNVSIGETVDTEHALFTVMNLDRVWAQLAVAPKDLPLVRVGQRAELTSETAPGRVFTGTIAAIGNTADETTRTVRVRCTLVNRDGALRPGTFMRGNIVTDVRHERVTVPLKALQEHQGKPTLYVALGQPGAFEVRHVKLGVRGEGWREITTGLEAGERIATGGTFYLKSEALKNSLSDGCCAPASGGG